MALLHVETDECLNSKSVHGVLVSVYGSGVLILGRSGIGKSACALDLIDRGHSLIADDVVSIDFCGNTLFGMAPPAFFGLIEVRGLGIVDVRHLFGEAAAVKRHEIGLCVKFTDVVDEDHTNRLEMQPQSFSLLGVEIPQVTFGLDGSRSLRVLVETAVKYFTRGGGLITKDLIYQYDESLLQERPVEIMSVNQ